MKINIEELYEHKEYEVGIFWQKGRDDSPEWVLDTAFYKDHIFAKDKDEAAEEVLDILLDIVSENPLYRIESFCLKECGNDDDGWDEYYNGWFA